MPEPTETIENRSGAGVIVPATAYVILRFNEATDEWSEYGDRVGSTSAQGAIRAHLTHRATDPTGTYVAVPARSWKPVTVQAVQTTTLKLEEAK